jgi:WD40 repeat protein
MKRATIVGVILFSEFFFANSSVAQQAKKPRLDAAGDPLPAQALHRFGTSRFCTQTEVFSLVLSQDGKLLAAADRDARVYLWDADTGKERLITSAGSGKRVAISPDGQWLALGEDAPFEVRNLRKNEAPRLPIGNAPRVFTFSPDSKAIAIAANEETDLILYDLANNKESLRYAGLDENIIVSTIAFSQDGKYLAAAGAHRPEPDKGDDKPFVRVVVWDTGKKDKIKLIDHAGKQVRNLVFLPDKKTLVSQVGSRLVAWDVTTGDPVKKIAHPVGSSFALDSACKILATTDGPKVIAFDSGKELYEFEAATLLRQLAMSGDGKLLAACAARFESASPRIMLWDLTTGKERTVAAAHRHYVEAVAFGHDGKAIATASNAEGVARVWDARTAKLLHAFNLDSLAAKKSGGPRARRTLLDSLVFCADRPELFVTGQRWDLTKAEPIPLKADDDFVFEQTNSVRAVMASDGRLAASFLHDHAILFWDPAKAQALGRIELDQKEKRGDWFAFAFSPNGKFAASGKWFPPIRPESDEPLENTVNIWDVKAGKRVKSFRASPAPVVRLMFAPDGETLAVIAFPARLELWHLPTGRLLREMYLTDIEESAQTIMAGRAFALPPIAFAAHGQWIAFTHQEGEIVLLETMTGKEIQTLHGHQGAISSVAFSPDSRRLLSGGRDTTALLWSVLPENPALPASWKDAEKLWLDLGGPPDQAYRIVWALMAHPGRAVEVLTKRLQPDEGANDKEIRELITNLSAAKFAQRDVAIRRLKQIGTRSLPALEQALKKAPDLETGRRIQELLKTVETSLTPETLRDVRAMQILEMIGTQAARKLLGETARGDAGAGKTRMAQAALVRLKNGN